MGHTEMREREREKGRRRKSRRGVVTAGESLKIDYN